MKEISIKRYIFKLICVLASTLLIAIFWKNNILIFSLLALITIIINIKSSKNEIIFLIIVSILATIVESIAMSTGAWRYTIQNIFNFPIWLPLYWGMGGVIMKDTYFVIEKIFKGKGRG